MGGQRHAPAALPPGKDPVPIVQEAGWAPGPVWTGAENLASTGIRSPDRPAAIAQSLYRLSYRGCSQHPILKGHYKRITLLVQYRGTVTRAEFWPGDMFGSGHLEHPERHGKVLDLALPCPAERSGDSLVRTAYSYDWRVSERQETEPSGELGKRSTREGLLSGSDSVHTVDTDRDTTSYIPNTTDSSGCYTEFQHAGRRQRGPARHVTDYVPCSQVPSYVMRCDICERKDRQEFWPILRNLLSTVLQKLIGIQYSHTHTHTHSVSSTI